MPTTAPRRGLGYLPDPPKGPGEAPDYRLLLSTAGPAPRSSYNRDLIVSVLNQGGLGACTANATMQAIRASHVLQCKAAGSPGAGPPPLGSRLWLYYLSRAKSGDTQHDAGTFLRFAFQALNEYGFCPEDVWPYADASDPTLGDRWRTPPSKAAMRAAFDQRAAAFVDPNVGGATSGGAGAEGFSYYRIYETGDDRIEVVKRALAKRKLVVFGTDVSREFVNGDFGTQPVDPTIGTLAGGHALCAVQHEDGLTQVNDTIDVVNSWGEDWGEKGYFKTTRDGVRKWRDVWIVRAAPYYSEVAA